MNYSYVMGINNIDKLKHNNFIIKSFGNHYGITFDDDKIELFEEFISESLENGFWNEYLGKEKVFIFKFNNGEVKKYILNKDNENEILKLCCEFADCNFESIDKMLMNNDFYAETYYTSEKMSEIVENIKKELIKRCNIYNEKYNYDFWNDHIKYVVKNAIELAQKYDADVEIVELGALLHDIAMPSEYGTREEHNVYGMEIADELLEKLNYPQDRKERVKECVLRHRGSKDLPRNTIEEQCVADADVIAHFDCIPSLFHLVYNEMNLSVNDGEKYIKKKLERDYNKLSERTRTIVKDRYNNILEVLFVDK